KVFLSSRRRHTRPKRDWSSDVCSSDLVESAESSDQRGDSSAKRAISFYRLRRVLEVGERTTRQNVQAKCEVLLRGAIVERQPTGSTDDVDAEPRQHHLVPVDPLMGVLADEHVIAARSGNGS